MGVAFLTRGVIGLLLGGWSLIVGPSAPSVLLSAIACLSMVKGSETIVQPSGYAQYPPAVLFAFCYLILRALLRIATDDGCEREAEILVLRHQLAVLKRSNPRPRLRRRDRMVIAALADLLDRDRWSGFIVSPATILRWHRDLVRRKWTFRHARLADRRSIPRWFV